MRMRVFAAKLGGLFGRRKADQDFDEEMRMHLHLLTEQGIRRGLSPEEARAAARRQFGNIPLLQQSQREMRSIMSLANLGRDLRFAARQLRRSPSLTTIAVVSLALGIGANTAIFTIAKKVLAGEEPAGPAAAHLGERPSAAGTSRVGRCWGNGRRRPEQHRLLLPGTRRAAEKKRVLR
jgi:hypothetical protein